MRIRQIKDLNISLRDVSLKHVNSLRASFRMDGSYYSRCTLLVAFHAEMRADDVNTPSSGCNTAGRYVLNNDAAVSWLNGLHRLEAMGQLHVESGVCLSEQLTLVRHIVREYKLALSETDGTKMSKLASKGIGIVRCDFAFVTLMKMSPDFAIVFEKEYN